MCLRINNPVRHHRCYLRSELRAKTGRTVKNACLGVLALLMLSDGLAFAGNEPVRLDFQADSGCPSALALADQVRARTELVRFVDPPGEGLPVRIRARNEGDHAIGRIRIGPADEAERVVTGRTCAEVISAL